ncbi:MAG TPA: polymer-forming cytoskeletal protein [Oscillospiraceae bacterium]|nr:polymer-forming cytoskeletal protein [Oscillospiraceae bacterium]HPF56513.1 polymer-forming cytoskeletal protein [Clostridiales bacterium]HPK35482.1 polymer-forming cytoskeletal protein [Oscillospiraceae bacterium]HPR75206.1 polymer-forming cytoskeletal protein [Oscillospiraceae bacterium]
MSKNDMHISGSGTIAAGEYGNVKISGSGKINGSISCTELHCSGSAKADGDILCSGDIKCSGSFHCSGNIDAGSITCSGAAKIGEAIKANTIKASGAIKATDMEAERIVLSGGCGVSGLLNAETVEINLGGKCSVGSIGGGKITVKLGGGSGFWLGRRRDDLLETGTIEGDEIELENTTADIVRGKNVIIGKNCSIKTVEYSGNLIVDGSSTVKQQTKI